MRLTSRLLRLASGVSGPSATPKNIWLKTKAPGIYVRPEEVDGQVWVVSDKPFSRSSDVRRTTYWDSRWAPEEFPVAEVDLHDRKGIALPGLQIIPEEMKATTSMPMHVYWDREELSGIEFSFHPRPPTGSNRKYLYNE
jgi:hypothetical protein